mgnify:CR=1 FL=1
MSEKKQNETAKNWVDRLLNNKIALVLLFCAGVLLMLLPALGNDDSGGASLPAASAAGELREGDNSLLAEGRNLALQAQKALGLIQGAGRVQVVLTLEKSSGSSGGESYGKSDGQLAGAVIRGVVITAEGAGDPRIKLTLYEAAAALFGIPENQIFVAEGTGE